MKQSPQQHANLRTCASCEWIYNQSDYNPDCGCPQCGFGSYGARFVYGDKAYKYAVNQKPWLDKKLSRYESELLGVIAENKPSKPLFNFK